MSTATLRKAALLIVAVAVFGTSAFAHEERREHRRDGRERHERMERRDHRERFERDREREHWRRERERREHERWAAEHRRYEHHPNGWDHGRKTGWHGNDVPPGQAKKYDGNPQFHGPAHDRSDYDSDRSHHNQVRPASSGSNGSNRNATAERWRAMMGRKQ